MRDSTGSGLDRVLVDPLTGKPSTFGNMVEHWDEAGWPETKCPDLGDWSDTPHDELENWPIPRDELDRFDSGLKELAYVVARIQKKRLIDLDRERLLHYNYD